MNAELCAEPSGHFSLTEGVDLMDGNLSKQTRGQADILCRQVGATEGLPKVESNSAENSVEQDGRRVDHLTVNEKVRCALHPSGAEGEDRPAMTRSEPSVRLMIPSLPESNDVGQGQDVDKILHQTKNREEQPTPISCLVSQLQRQSNWKNIKKPKDRPPKGRWFPRSGAVGLSFSNNILKSRARYIGRQQNIENHPITLKQIDKSKRRHAMKGARKKREATRI